MCQPGKFECAGVDALEGDGCIPEIYLCDGHEDCKDGHDEKGCECKQHTKYAHVVYYISLV